MAKHTTSAATTTPPLCQISGVGNVQGDIAFTIHLISAKYTPEEVSDMLDTGDMYFYLGDATLKDGDEEMIGTIEWGLGRGDFVPHEVHVDGKEA